MFNWKGIQIGKGKEIQVGDTKMKQRLAMIGDVYLYCRESGLHLIQTLSVLRSKGPHGEPLRIGNGQTAGGQMGTCRIFQQLQELGQISYSFVKIPFCQH